MIALFLQDIITQYVYEKKTGNDRILMNIYNRQAIFSSGGH
jgi:hypothetical protein